MTNSKSRTAGQASQRLERWERLFQALAHATRRQILLVLWFRGGGMSAGAIVSRFACTWPTISRHLKVLMDAELVTCLKQGKTRKYAVNVSQLDEVRAWLDWFRPETRFHPKVSQQLEE